MKHHETKNNTCAGCGEHIDKSSTTESWVTLQRSSFWLVIDDKEEFCKGWRKTYHLSCAGKILEASYQTNKED